MKILNIDPEIKLSALPIFKLVLILFPLLALIIVLVIYLNSNLKPDLSYEGFNFALFTIFRVPFALMATGVTILGFIAAIHRSSQMTLQIKKASEQNTFSNFYKHRQEYEEHFTNIKDEFPDHIKEYLNGKVIRGYYNSTFPGNSPSNFVLKPRLSWLEYFDKSLIEMSYLLSKMQSCGAENKILLLYSEFLRQETSIRQDLFEISKPENAEVVQGGTREITIKYWNGKSNRVSFVENLMDSSFKRLKSYAEFISKLKYVVGEFEGTMVYGCDSYTGLSTLEYHNELDDDKFVTKLLYRSDLGEIEISKSEYEELGFIFTEVRNSYERKISELDRIRERTVNSAI